MDVNITAILSMFLSLLLIMPALSIPLDSQETQEHLEEKRPKYMDTRELGDMMQDLVYNALKELVRKGKLSEEVFPPPEGFVENSEAASGTTSVDKRRRHLSYCLRRSGPNFVPYPCYKYGGRR
ncbi:uncharacterized protein LOC132559872 [Ylistrum balloti]|uniref:uncharacterized protein LOC132559872 n=1 Tax=Ylistrum balloti TaxID=509963 RepID=UPI002905DF1A|nr:uncharacterized protein LOC132559872 [Ylistrum balloti]